LDKPDEGRLPAALLYALGNRNAATTLI